MFYFLIHSLLALIMLKSSKTLDLFEYNTMENYCRHPNDEDDSYESIETRRMCDCRLDAALTTAQSTWLTSLILDCSFKSLYTENFEELLPMMVTTFDASWNHIERIPHWNGGRLQRLILSNNLILSLNDDNFINLKHLHELILSFNHLQTINAKAFRGLSELRTLDLAHNELLMLTNAFQPLTALENLDLSFNQFLNESITSMTTSGNLYDLYDIIPTLKTLKLQKCNLQTIRLPVVNISLTVLDLRGNLLNEIPKQLPDHLRRIDLSDNLLKTLQENDTQHLRQVNEIRLEDMADLVSIERYALRPLTALETISFENSRKLSKLDAYAFGANTSIADYHLRKVNLRGTSLRTLSPQLSAIFLPLEQLDLKGLPLHCDCELLWLKQLPLESNGQCRSPSDVRNHNLHLLPAASYQCKSKTAHWAYGCVILILIIMLLMGLWCLVMGPKAIGTLTSRRSNIGLRPGSIGADSPYARMTITAKPSRKPLII